MRLYSTLTHTDIHGKAQMIDVSPKSITPRKAIAQAIIYVGPKIHSLIKENQLKKGDVLSVAQLAGILAAKKTSELIPLCHNIFLTSIKLDLKLTENNTIHIQSTIQCDGKTGVEMEALTACTVAALTVYDMCKAVSHDMVIKDIRLLHKSGGKNLYNYDKNNVP